MPRGSDSQRPHAAAPAPPSIPSEEAPDLVTQAAECFRAMVEGVGIKRFADAMGLSTRQVNRILSGAQPNPIERLIRSIHCCDPKVGDDVMQFICLEVGGHFVRHEDIDSASINAIKECAEAIAAISDGEISRMDEVAIREAVSALVSLAQAVRQRRGDSARRRRVT